MSLFLPTRVSVIIYGALAKYKYSHNLYNFKCYIQYTIHSLHCSHWGNQHETGREIKEELTAYVQTFLERQAVFFLLFIINRIICKINQVTRSPTETILRTRWSIMLWKHFLFWELLESTHFIQRDTLFLYRYCEVYSNQRISNRTKLGIIFQGQKATYLKHFNLNTHQRGNHFHIVIIY